MSRNNIGALIAVILALVLGLTCCLIKITRSEVEKKLGRRKNRTKYFHQGSRLVLITIFVVIVLVLLFRYLLHMKIFPVKFVTPETTKFATLITIILSLVAVLVPMYLSLISSLEGRKEYERENIVSYRRHVNKIIITCVSFSCVCIVGCLTADNNNNNHFRSIAYGIMGVSVIDILCLVFLILQLVRYEKSLVKTAKAYIEHNIRKFADSEVEIQDFAVGDIIKDIGDLEIIISNLVKNHEADFRYGIIPAEDRLYRTIVLKKWENTCGVEAWKEQEKDRAEAFCKDYSTLIEIRNRLWIVQRSYQEFSGGKEAMDFSGERRKEYPEKLKKRINNMFSEAIKNLMQGERFKEQNFMNLDFVNARLKNASFRQSAFASVTFETRFMDDRDISNSKNLQPGLDDADFTDAFMQTIHFKNINCSGAVFRGAKIYGFSIEDNLHADQLKPTSFYRAVFDNAEITFENTRNSLSGQSYNRKYNFCEISGKELNLIGAVLNNVDFKNSSLNHILLHGGEMNNCSFDYCNLKGAAFTDTTVIDCSFSRANMEDLSAAFSVWHGRKKTAKDIMLYAVRLSRANFTDASMKNCNFRGAYINDAYFGEAELDSCSFNDAFLDHSDFTNVKMTGVKFENAGMRGVLITGKDEGLTDIRESVFSGAKLIDSEIRNRTFINCNFDQTILSNAIIRNVIFINCSFRDCQFDGVLLMNVDWQNSTNLNASDWIDRKDGRNILFGSKNDRRRFTGKQE